MDLEGMLFAWLFKWAVILYLAYHFIKFIIPILIFYKLGRFIWDR